ncbi:hypothetical protein HYFRA_00009439 [Hymenoscyphus fraxineus]|uniref:Uncharacterized protein n=1 Tax=Hymenoscyphus fraxineus TaxID=746836 RepID=A0A9N9L581_9HELO|nr:hypothetical protein HYFRA_00009439 [Hymenoscyphus fraxineus]
MNRCRSGLQVATARGNEREHNQNKASYRIEPTGGRRRRRGLDPGDEPRDAPVCEPFCRARMAASAASAARTATWFAVDGGVGVLTLSSAVPRTGAQGTGTTGFALVLSYLTDSNCWVSSSIASRSARLRKAVVGQSVDPALPLKLPTGLIRHQGRGRTTCTSQILPLPAKSSLRSEKRPTGLSGLTTEQQNRTYGYRVSDHTIPYIPYISYIPYRTVSYRIVSVYSVLLLNE